ncbi:hypothetical protein G6F31_018010 [Rhizopus arrhizus]|nr:hypothetical protein G6F31_018010 [Rhizopus arrhizus]
MPRVLFDRIGGWDAGYRLHAEDLDLCRRAREAGAPLAAVLCRVAQAQGPVALLPEIRGEAALATGARCGMGGDLGACADAGAAPAAQVVVEPSPRSAQADPAERGLGSTKGGRAPGSPRRAHNPPHAYHPVPARHRPVQVHHDAGGAPSASRRPGAVPVQVPYPRHRPGPLHRPDRRRNRPPVQPALQ